MQLFRTATNGRSAPERCARDLLAAVPLVMRFIRAEMRRHRRAPLTVPHFRALVFLSHYDEASLSSLAEHVGLSLPATSRMVELLVRRGMLLRRPRSSDRRCVRLSLTARGRATYRAALRATQAALARRFETLSAPELALIGRAMEILGRTFQAEQAGLAAVR
jgi:DNA-binding MarR family transcriptional regulator